MCDTIFKRLNYTNSASFVTFLLPFGRMIDFTRRQELTASEKIDVRELWNNEYPEQLRLTDMSKLEEYLAGLAFAEHLLVYTKDGTVAAWAVKFIRNEERSFVIIVASSLHRTGIGKQLLNVLKMGETQLTGWAVDHQRYLKSNQQTYLSPLPFYLMNSFSIAEASRLELPTLSAVKIIWKSRW